MGGPPCVNLIEAMTRTPSLSSKLFRYAAISVGAVFIAACVDSPQEPSTAADSPLASTFDGLSKESTANGDNARGNEFEWAAVAIAAGITPSQLVVLNNGKRETYDAFVHATTISAANVTDGLTTRTLIAWRKVTRVLQVIMISAPDNVSNVLHPASMGPISISNAPFRGAHAAYYERPERATTAAWIGVGGTVKLTDVNLSAQPCEFALPVTSGVGCVRARFAVSFDVKLALLPVGARVPNAVADRTLRAVEQPINGLKLSVRCLAPSLETKGCPTTSTKSR